MPQYVVVVNAKHLNIVQKENVAKNVIRIISVLNAYYGNNAYCVRIKGVLSPQRAATNAPTDQKGRVKGCRYRLKSLFILICIHPQHSIADADVRLYVLLPVFSAFQLFAQGRHEHPQRSNIVFPTAAPNLLCDVGVGQNLAHIF